MKRLWCLALVFLIGCSGEKTTSSGVRYLDLAEGTGPAAQTGDYLEVEYSGTLADGTEFDSSRRPLKIYALGEGMIRGFSDGLIGMKDGGKRKLWIPPALGYGKTGSPPKIPADAELIFEVEVVRLISKNKK